MHFIEKAQVVYNIIPSQLDNLLHFIFYFLIFCIYCTYPILVDHNRTIGIISFLFIYFFNFFASILPILVSSSQLDDWHHFIFIFFIIFFSFFSTIVPILYLCITMGHLASFSFYLFIFCLFIYCIYCTYLCITIIGQLASFFIDISNV